MADDRGRPDGAGDQAAAGGPSGLRAHCAQDPFEPIDEVWMFRDTRPGSLPANRDFLARSPEFEHDTERNERFLLTHHPVGWLRRRT